MRFFVLGMGLAAHVHVFHVHRVRVRFMSGLRQAEGVETAFRAGLSGPLGRQGVDVWFRRGLRWGYGFFFFCLLMPAMRISVGAGQPEKKYDRYR